MNKCAKLKQNICFTAIGMGIPCEAPKSSSFYFSLVPPRVSQQFHLVDIKEGFLPLKQRRLIFSSLSFQLLPHSFLQTKSAETRQDFSTCAQGNTKLADTNQAHTDSGGSQSLMLNPGLYCKWPEMWFSFNPGFALATLKYAYSHLS